MERGSVEDFEATRKTVSNALVHTTRHANRIASEDVTFYRSSNAMIAHSLDERSSRLLSLAQNLMHRASDGTNKHRPRLASMDSVEINWRSIVDNIDTLLERADLALDEFSGLFKKQVLEEHSIKTQGQVQGRFALRGFRDMDIPKPQLLFEEKPFNHEASPFSPILSVKPHARVPLQTSVKLENNQYTHPYQTELENYEFPTSVYKSSEPLRPSSLHETAATFIDDMDGVRAMLKQLQKAPEIAVDLEHHDLHSYIGIVCLMQISTRDQDWIIDTLKPWRRQLQCLNEIFTNPRILKVFHGSTSDMVWLQRDLGLYVVGLFDTYHASCVLGYPGHSLAYLLKRFVDFDAQKQYQMADWRVRPLPEELFDYARSDTHFLLYIYDCMRNELLETSNAKCDRMEPVLNRSRNEALQRYEHPFYVDAPQKSANGWYNHLWRSPGTLSSESLAVFRRIHRWRDHVARQEDESPNHVMSHHALFAVARTLPEDKAGIFASSHPISSVLRTRVEELLSVVADGVAHPEDGAQLIELMMKQQMSSNPSKSTIKDETNTPRLANESMPSSAIPTASDVRSSESHFWGMTMQDTLGSSRKPPSLEWAHIQVPGLGFYSTPPKVDDGSALPSQPESIHPTGSGMNQKSTGLRLAKRKHEGSHNAAEGHGAPDNSKSIGAQIEASSEQSTNLQQYDDAIARVRAKAARKLQKKPRPQYTPETAEEAFDYANSAPISAGTSNDQDKRRGKSSFTSFNPFAKAAEAADGLGRVSQPQSGKTATFKR